MSGTTQLKIDGMTCQHCVAAVEKALAEVPGVTEVIRVTLEPGGASIRGDASADNLITAVRKAGYQASVVE